MPDHLLEGPFARRRRLFGLLFRERFDNGQQFLRLLFERIDHIAIGNTGNVVDMPIAIFIAFRSGQHERELITLGLRAQATRICSVFCHSEAAGEDTLSSSRMLRIGLSRLARRDSEQESTLFRAREATQFARKRPIVLGYAVTLWG